MQKRLFIFYSFIFFTAFFFCVNDTFAGGNGKAKEYHFISHWKLQTSIDTVFPVIANSLAWHEWWKNMKEVKTVFPGDKDSIGNIRTYTLKSPVGYRLHFELKLTQFEHNKLLSAIASGDLVGTGEWHFIEEKDTALITCIWNVQTTKNWMNTFHFILAPLLRWNHSLVMKKGAKGLAKKLHCRLLAY